MKRWNAKDKSEALNPGSTDNAMDKRKKDNKTNNCPQIFTKNYRISTRPHLSFFKMK